MIRATICLILLNITVVVCSIRLPCHFLESINITEGTLEQPSQLGEQRQQQQVQNSSSIVFDDIEFPWNKYAMVDYTEDDGVRNVTAPHLRGCLCEVKACHRLCCSNEQITINNETVNSLREKCNEELNQIEMEVSDESSKFINLLLGYPVVKIDNKTCLQLFVQKDYLNGSMQLNQSQQTLNSHGYCHTRIDQDTNIHIDVSICIAPNDEVEPEAKKEESNPYAVFDHVNHIARLISIFCLIITLALYIWLPKLHINVPGKCFICYLICQSASFILINYYFDTVPINLRVYLHLCSFQWLNVTAFDIWWNLRSFKNVSQRSKSSERRRLFAYMLYALLSPFLFDAFDFVSVELGTFIVNREQATDIVFAIFTGVTFTINIVFFVLTTLNIRKVRNGLTSQQDSSRHQKQMCIDLGNFQLYVRLYLAMGLSHSVMQISYVLAHGSICFNLAKVFLSLQGVWIFLLFVFKPRIFHLIKERCVCALKSTQHGIELNELRGA